MSDLPRYYCGTKDLLGHLPTVLQLPKRHWPALSGKISFLQPMLGTAISQPLQPRVCESQKSSEFVKISSALSLYDR